MKKQKRIKKIKFPHLIEDIKDLALKRLVNLLVFAVFIFVSFLLVKAFLYQSDYFRLRSVDMRNSSLDQRAAAYVTNQLLGQYRSKSIFRINMKSVAGYIRELYPDSKEIVVKLVLPDRISISMKLRRPVAFIRNGRLYPIDEDGYVLPRVDANALVGLPVIEGTGVGYFERRSNRSMPVNLKLALELLREIRYSRFMGEYGLEKIDAQDPDNIVFFIKDGIEVRIGNESFKDRIEVLIHTLKDPRLLLDKIQYIDLRFKDVVIGPK